MERRRTFNIAIPVDDEGFIGRECPECKEYFKIRPGTGLPGKLCHCPYCQREGDTSEFTTAAQKDYAISIAVKEVVEPGLKKLSDSLKHLEQSSSEYVKIRVTGGAISLPVHTYSEKEVETRVICDGCGLEFAVFGVFARCPDCTKLNHRLVFDKSMEQCKKRMSLVDRIDDADTASSLMQDCIASSVSSFDALGKGLRQQAPDVLISKKRNLFQDLDGLSRCLEGTLGKGLADIIGESDYRFIRRMFQVRHACQHNMGVVDEETVRKCPELHYLKGRKYPISKDETSAFIDALGRAARKLIDCIVTEYHSS